MARVKSGVTAKARHKKVLGKAKGYYGARSKLFKTAKQAVIKAGQYAYRDRRQRKRQFRALWITRINAAARLHGMTYSRLINGMNLAEIPSCSKRASIAANFLIERPNEALGLKITSSFKWFASSSYLSNMMQTFYCTCILFGILRLIIWKEPGFIIRKWQQ